jgi:excisionase family DNA binding protein
MPRGKPKTVAGSKPTAVNGPLAEVLTLAEAAAYLRVAESEILRLVHDQGLPGRQVGTDWRFLKFALQDWLRGETPPRSSSKQALLVLAGKFKDDPDLENIVEEAYRRRGRPMTEDA